MLTSNTATQTSNILGVRGGKVLVATVGLELPNRQALPMKRAITAFGIVATRSLPTSIAAREPRALPNICLFASNIENDAKARFAAHHSLVCLGGFFQRENFVHRVHV
jgi:hypothetical protein